MRPLIAVGVAAALLAAASAHGDLLNPGFADNGGAGSTANNWTGSGKQGVQNWGSHDGDGWLQAFWEWGAGTSAQIYQDVAGIGNAQYTLSFWQEGDEKWEGTAFTASLIWLDGVGSPIGSAAMLDLQDQAFANNGWTNRVLTGLSPAGTATVRVQFDASPMDSGDGAGKIDDLSLTEAIPEPAVASLVLIGVGLLAQRRFRKRA